MDFKTVRGEMAKLEQRSSTGTFLSRTDESDEVIVGTAVGVEFAWSFQRRTRDKPWQRDVFTTFIGAPWNPRRLAVEAPMASSRKRYITKSLVQQHTPGCSACLGVSSQHTTKCRERFEQLINPNATDVIPAIPSAVEDPSLAGGAASAEQQHATQPDTSKRQGVGMKRGAEDNPMSSSAKRAHTPAPPLSQILPQPDVEMETVRVPVPEDAMEVNALCEETFDPPDMEAFFDAAGEFHDHYTGKILNRDETIAGIRAELTQMQEFGVFEWKLRSEKTSNEKIISTKMFHKAKGDEVRSIIVAREYADGVFAPGHHASTPPTWAL